MIGELITSLTWKPPLKHDTLFSTPEYRKVYSTLKNGDLWFVEGSGIVSKVIGWFTHSPLKLSHVGIVWKLPKVGRIFIIHATLPKVKISLWLPSKHDHFARILKIVDDREREEIITNALSYVDLYGYAVRGLIGWITGRKPSRYRKFCSMFVQEVLMKSGIEIIKDEPENTSPQDLWESVFVEELRF